jgi:acyl-CoA thioesterase
MAHGEIYDRAGRLIASTAQELLARYDRRAPENDGQAG